MVLTASTRVSDRNRRSERDIDASGGKLLWPVASMWSARFNVDESEISSCRNHTSGQIVRVASDLRGDTELRIANLCPPIGCKLQGVYGIGSSPKSGACGGRAREEGFPGESGGDIRERAAQSRASHPNGTGSGQYV